MIELRGTCEKQSNLDESDTESDNVIRVFFAEFSSLRFGFTGHLRPCVVNFSLMRVCNLPITQPRKIFFQSSCPPSFPLLPSPSSPLSPSLILLPSPFFPSPSFPLPPSLLLFPPPPPGRKSGKGCYVYSGRKGKNKNLNTEAEGILERYRQPMLGR